MTMMQVAAAAAVALVAAAPAAGRQGGDEPLAVSAVRFYSPASATTTIETVCEVRLGAVLRTAGQRRYRVDVAVLDSAGLELQRSDWERQVPGTVVTGATVVESFSFPAAPGAYRIRVRVSPPEGPAAEQTVQVRAFGVRPAISDLLLATEVRRLGTDSGAPEPGQVRRGGYAMRTAPVPRLLPTEARLNWYAEVYPRAGATSGELRVEVIGAGDRVIVAAPPRTVQVGATGSALPGSLDLTGLPEGPYRLRLRLQLGDTTLAAQAAFAVAPMSAVAAQVPAPVAETGDQFTDADEARLDSLFAPLVYVVEDRSQTSAYGRLTVEGKRRFLREFWQRRDPTPGTPANERRDEFYRAVEHVNTAYREPGRGDVPGWNTDRGRIYLKYGRPDETLLRRTAVPRPYEAWKYTRNRAQWFVFMDNTSLGNYRLVGTNDRTEQALPGWDQFSSDNVQDISQFIGLPIGSND